MSLLGRSLLARRHATRKTVQSGPSPVHTQRPDFEGKAATTITLSLLFLLILLAAFWPENRAAGLGYTHELHIGFAFVFLLLQAPVAAILAEQTSVSNVSLGGRWLLVWSRQILLVAAAVPMTILLYWTGFFAGTQWLLLHGGAVLAAAAFAFWAVSKRSHLQIALLATVYFAGMAAIFWFWGLHYAILPWIMVFLLSGLFHWRKVGSDVSQLD